jgi:hypothetical protein
MGLYKDFILCTGVETETNSADKSKKIISAEIYGRFYVHCLWKFDMAYWGGAPESMCRARPSFLPLTALRSWNWSNSDSASSMMAIYSPTTTVPWSVVIRLLDEGCIMWSRGLDLMILISVAWAQQHPLAKPWRRKLDDAGQPNNPTMIDSETLFTCFATIGPRVTRPRD